MAHLKRILNMCLACLPPSAIVMTQRVMCLRVRRHVLLRMVHNVLEEHTVRDESVVVVLAGVNGDLTLALSKALAMVHEPRTLLRVKRGDDLSRRAVHDVELCGRLVVPRYCVQNCLGGHKIEKVIVHWALDNDNVFGCQAKRMDKRRVAVLDCAEYFAVSGNGARAVEARFLVGPHVTSSCRRTMPISISSQ